jgi:hypothetical protein
MFLVAGRGISVERTLFRSPDRCEPRSCFAYIRMLSSELGLLDLRARECLATQVYRVGTASLEEDTVFQDPESEIWITSRFLMLTDNCN